MFDLNLPRAEKGMSHEVVQNAHNAVMFFIMYLGPLFLKIFCTGIVTLKPLGGKIKNQYIPDILGHGLE